MRAFNLKKHIVVPAFLALIASAAHAAPCSNGSLKGSFGITFSVLQDNFGVPGANIPAGFLEEVGVIQFNGTGGSLGSITYSRNDGDVQTYNTTFSYSVASNCTFTFVRNDNGESYAGVIVRNGQEFDFIETSGACCGTAIVTRGHGIRVHTDS
jgi:hypothetical protein